MRQLNINPITSEQKSLNLLQQTLNGCIKGDTYTTAAGSATQEISVPGATGGDIAMVTMKASGATPRVIKSAAADTDKIIVVLDGDPGNDHTLSWLLVTLT